MLEKFDLKARHNARKLAIQALYQWSITGHDIKEIESQFLLNNANKRIEYTYLIEIIHKVPENIELLDHCFTPHLKRDIADIDGVELAILRLASYELKFRLDIPFQVIINEALELTKKFGSVEGFKFINSVLDKTATQLRTQEQ